MKVKKKYEGGGMFETSRATQRKLRKAAKKSEKRKKRRQDIIDEGTPSNPRFMMGAPTRVNGAVPKKTEDDKKKKKKKKVINPRGRAGVTSGTRRMLQRAVDASCRGGRC